MRMGMWTVAALIGLGMAEPASAQFLTGTAGSRKIVNQPIPTNINAPTALGSFNLTGLFHRVNVQGGSPIVGYSPLPSPGQFPSTKFPNFKSTPFEPANPINIFNPLKVIKNQK